MFAETLRSLAGQDYIMQSSDGLLLLGPKGEKLTAHYSFYAAFSVEEEYRIACEGKVLGTIPISSAIAPGMYIIFAGKRWRILEVDGSVKRIDVAPSSAGKPPKFSGEPGFLHDEVLKRMFLMYTSDEVPRYLDDTAIQLLQEGRYHFNKFRMQEKWVVSAGKQTYLFPWLGTTALNAITLSLIEKEIEAGLEATYLIVEAEADYITEALAALAKRLPPEATTLASVAHSKESEKYHSLLPEDLLCYDFASMKLDVEPAWRRLSEIRYHSPSKVLN